MDSNHEARIIRVNEVLKHPNADSLGIVQIGGYQCVVKLGEFQPGDLAIYIQPDSVVPERPEYAFIWGDRDFGGPVPEKYRRVTARRFRKEWSEGLLMPCVKRQSGGYSLPRQSMEQCDVYPAIEGADASQYLGITHYNPPEPVEVEDRGPSKKQSKVWPRSLKGWMYFLSYWMTFGLYDPWGALGGSNVVAPKNTPPIYDVETFKNFPRAFNENDQVIVTEKIHGSNARFTFEPGTFGGKFYIGSRKLWKRLTGDSIWNRAAKVNPDIERWCRDNPGYTLYGEVVPTQDGFNYGATSDKPRVLFFDVRTPDGEWISVYESEGTVNGNYNLEFVPLLYTGAFNHSGVQTYVDGKSMVPNANHIREGVVILAYDKEEQIRGLGRNQLKIVSNAYYEKQGKQ